MKWPGFGVGRYSIDRPPKFRMWFVGIKDERAATTIAARQDRLAFGHFGDARPVGKGVSELRIHHGPVHRVYLRQRGGGPSRDN
ncbi:MAG: hypothetical protein OXQ29_08400 [Rhodospirillaceae bacterium]|nr:hypothetical protein [Rhodospirillaceae bacterium]